MPTLYETKWLRRHFGWKSTNNPKSSGDSFVYGSLRADTQDIDKVMREIVSELGNEWQIKSAVPLVASAYTKSTVGMPWSMENTFTDGILVICQHSYEISEEELAIRKKAESEKKRVDAGQEERENRAMAVLCEPIETRRAMLGRAKYIWRGMEFDTETEAIQRREDQANMELSGRT